MSDDKKNVVDVEVISEEHDDSRKNGGTYTATYYYTNSGNGTGYERHYTYQDMFGLHAPGRDGLQYAGIGHADALFLLPLQMGLSGRPRLRLL